MEGQTCVVETQSSMKCTSLMKLVSDVLALARHLESMCSCLSPRVEPLDSESELFSIRWVPDFKGGVRGWDTVIVSKSGLVFEVSKTQERHAQVTGVTGTQAFELLTEMRSTFEREAVDAEVRLMETQAQRERTEQARKNIYEKLALSAPRG